MSVNVEVAVPRNIAVYSASAVWVPTFLVAAADISSQDWKVYVPAAVVMMVRSSPRFTSNVPVYVTLADIPGRVYSKVPAPEGSAVNVMAAFPAGFVVRKYAVHSVFPLTTTLLDVVVVASSQNLKVYPAAGAVLTETVSPVFTVMYPVYVS